MMSTVYAPPPLLTVVGGTYTVLPHLNYDDNNERDSDSSLNSSSIIIVIIVIASAIIASASLYLLLRFISRRCRRSFHTFSVTDDVVSRNDSQPHRCFHGGRLSPDELIDSLPLFTFGSVNRTVAGGDCAVCLSNFEPHDQLRLLPLCCHAFHARCIDTWLMSNQTCPLCRSIVYPAEPDVLNKILSSSAADDRRNSFRIEIGSVSRRQAASESGDRRRSYSIGSFDYIVDDGFEVDVESTHRRGISDCTSVDKESTGVPASQPAEMPEPPGQSLAAEVAGGRSWLREYVDRFNSSISASSRTISFRSSGRFFTGSSRRSDVVVPVDDLEANRVGEEISELFRWLSGV